MRHCAVIGSIQRSVFPRALDMPESRQSPPNVIHGWLQIRIGVLPQRDELPIVLCGRFSIAACFIQLAEPSENPMEVPGVGNDPLDTRCIHEVLEHGNGGIRHAGLIERTPHIGIGTYHAHFERTLVARLPKLGRGNARTALR